MAVEAEPKFWQELRLIFSERFGGTVVMSKKTIGSPFRGETQAFLKRHKLGSKILTTGTALVEHIKRISKARHDVMIRWLLFTRLCTAQGRWIGAPKDSRLTSIVPFSELRTTQERPIVSPLIIIIIIIMIIISKTTIGILRHTD